MKIEIPFCDANLRVANFTNAIGSNVLDLIDCCDSPNIEVGFELFPGLQNDLGLPKLECVNCKKRVIVGYTSMNKESIFALQHYWNRAQT